LSARETLTAPRLTELARLDDAAFRSLFAKTAIKRTGRDRFVRNVAIAIGNSGDQALASEVEHLLADTSALVRGAAVWALSQLLPKQQLAAVAVRRRGEETEPSVEEEWVQALSDHSI